MNNRPVEQALATLVPTHSDDIPQELLSLAQSFVAQSRSFSSSLKPEEEIARPFACAEIACKRLTRALKLPPLLGHPPCPPRTYKKLYAFLDRILNTGLSGTKQAGSNSARETPSRSISAPLTPVKGSREPATPSKHAATPRGLENTPSKPTPLQKTTNLEEPSTPRTPQRTVYVRSNGISAPSIIPDAPSWVMTSIRTVCKTLSTPAPRQSTWSRPPISKTLPPHIFAGVSSILYFISKISTNIDDEFDEEVQGFLEPLILTDKENDEEFKDITNTLIVAVYFIVLARRRQPSTSSEDFAQDESKKMDKKTFSEMRQTALVCLGLASTEKKYREDVDQWIALIMEQSWAQGKEWFENIPKAGELDGDDRFISDEEGVYSDEENAVHNSKRQRMGIDYGSAFSRDTLRRGLLPGLGTMMQDRVDWLNPDRAEDYIEWKTDILSKVERLG